jgi:hypothetical protein
MWSAVAEASARALHKYTILIWFWKLCNGEYEYSIIIILLVLIVMVVL